MVSSSGPGTRALKQYVEFSRSVAPNFSFVQGGGGNVSIKAEPYLIVKASGTRLGDASDDHGFVVLDQRKARSCIETSRDLETSVHGTSRPGRPSIEAPLHIVCGGRFVAHIHSAGAIAIGLTSVGPSWSISQGWQFLPFEIPGSPLLNNLMHVREFHNQMGVALLGNHGLMVWADSLDDCVSLTMEVENRCRQFLCGSGLHEFESTISSSFNSDQILDFETTKSPNWLEFIVHNVLFPDQVVLFPLKEDWPPKRSRLQLNVSGLSRDRAEMMQFLHLLGHLVRVEDCVRTLTPDECRRILGMEDEKYRQSLIS